MNLQVTIASVRRERNERLAVKRNRKIGRKRNVERMNLKRMRKSALNLMSIHQEKAVERRTKNVRKRNHHRLHSLKPQHLRQKICRLSRKFATLSSWLTSPWITPMMTSKILQLTKCSSSTFVPSCKKKIHEFQCRN